jgi:hypothetical protein
MRHNWITRASVALVTGIVVVVCASEGDASTLQASNAAGTSLATGVIPNRPAAYTLPAGCGPAGKKLQCNPLTNAGCDRAKDEGCDDDDHGGFGCYAGPNTVKEGGKCDDDDGCQGGLGCDTDDGDDEGVCRRFCCTDSRWLPVVRERAVRRGRPSRVRPAWHRRANCAPPLRVRV